MMDYNNRILLLINGGSFIVIGSVMSRLHVLQAWMGMNYEQFSWVLFCFSFGAILSNLTVGRLMPYFAKKPGLESSTICAMS